MGFFIGIIVIFAFIWIVVKAFSSNEKIVEVTIVDKETGERKTEVRKEVNSSAGKTASQVTLFIFIGIHLIFIMMAIIMG